MGDVVIRTEDLGKLYRVGLRKQRVHTLRDAMTAAARDLFRSRKAGTEDFWALRHLDFSVASGERVGVIGRNGAGKSTLLKLLSRITWPTEGSIRLRGRVASLLEVGTGFHPELTGRENIFLNGAILGMSKQDIRRRFDAIVEFAEVEHFLDTPTKRYSSGMYVRLAFAVAAHLEPDILIVDEVLAVGDAQFQKKCVGRLTEIGSDGRTILVVSHNMALINALCSRAILLSQGKLVDDGPAARVSQVYFGGRSESGGVRDFRSEQVGTDRVRLLEVRIESGAGEPVNTVDINEPVYISIRFSVTEDAVFKRHGFYPQINVCSAQGDVVFVSIGPTGSRLEWPRGEYVATMELPGGLLNAETYSIAVALATCDVGTDVQFYQPSVLNLTVSERILDQLEARSGYAGHMPGVMRPRLSWELTRVAAPLRNVEAVMTSSPVED